MDFVHFSKLCLLTLLPTYFTNYLLNMQFLLYLESCSSSWWSKIQFHAYIVRFQDDFLCSTMMSLCYRFESVFLQNTMCFRPTYNVISQIGLEGTNLIVRNTDQWSETGKKIYFNSNFSLKHTVWCSRVEQGSLRHICMLL